jgi:hypothetical protein
MLSALVVASLGDFRHKGRLLLISAAVWVAALALFGLSRSIGVAVLDLMILGAAQNGVAAASITLLQTRVYPYRDRQTFSTSKFSMRFGLTTKRHLLAKNWLICRSTGHSRCDILDDRRRLA